MRTTNLRKTHRHIGLTLLLTVGVAGATGLVSASPVHAAKVTTAADYADGEFSGLKRGDHGEGVRQLQELIKSAGSGLEVVDGNFGADTELSLKVFQKAYMIEPTGYVDAPTNSILKGLAGDSAPAAAQAASPAPEVTSAAPAAQSAPATNGLVGLKIGQRGATVKKAQGLIIASGFPIVGGADGIFGARTASALRSLQNANGLTVTGVVDEATASILLLAQGQQADHPAPTSSNPLVGLRYGAIGSDVSALQRALIANGVSVPGGADGMFGRNTAQALKQFQSAHGLEASGIVTTETAAALANTNQQPNAGGTSNLVGLKYGSIGHTVQQLQELLIKVGLAPAGGADGIFGPATSRAVKSFQSTQGLSVTGVVDEATLAALKSPTQAVTTPTPSSPSGYARYGERSQRVRSLQTALVNAGISVRGGVDGIFGGGTASAVMAFQTSKGLPSTGRVDEATATALSLAAADAPSSTSTVTVELDAFPVGGHCGYVDTWHAPRSGGRRHLGADIIASKGNKLRAVVDGTIGRMRHDRPGSLGGNALYIRTDDGTYFYYAHLDAFAEGLETGMPVTAGQVIGTVGSTGNAGVSHLHFEVHPQGGGAINPYPVLNAAGGCS
ncbi:MAG: hypothetical protein CSA55_05055 [Ilumatobacter coccineus]|uniref:Metalloendopeptidase n=1 Tax=Ilumatobacter coccineus TaxID=467094 RepID=A0A2G6K7Q9_9ACTN|nr:MAG: hypothetical protein CSA55_05055 [Ilumatobacter coccineus]